MRLLDRLRKEGLDAAKFRGHTMSTFKRYTDEQAQATCIVCNAIVTVNAHPAPNDIEVSGNAVALTCPAEPESQTYCERWVV